MSLEVSIITPSFNSEQYIARTIRSVLDQTFQDWEMIIVDDCSTDGTLDIVNAHCLKDPRIKVLSLLKNGGTGKARNIAINNAEGRFLAFLDADDYWAKNKLELQIEYMKENNISFSYTDYYEFDNKTGRLLNLVKSPKKVNYKMLLLNGGYIGCLTVIYDTFFFGKRKMPNVRKRQDWALWLKMLKEIDYAHGIQTPLAYYRLGNSSLSRSKIKLIKHNFRVYKNELGMSFFESYYRMFRFLIFYVLFKSNSKVNISHLNGKHS